MPPSRLAEDAKIRYVDIGESLVGAYMRHIRECDVVTYNTFLRGKQGEHDVVAMRLTGPSAVWLCEVTTHIWGMAYGKGNKETVARLRRKLDRARGSRGHLPGCRAPLRSLEPIRSPRPS